MSDEMMSTDSSFDWHATLTPEQAMNDLDRSTEEIASQKEPYVTRSPSKSLMDDEFPTLDANESTWDSGWDLQQITTSFPDTNTSGTDDIFEFDSEWQSSPSRENHNHDDRTITSTIGNQRGSTIGNYSSAQVLPKSHFEPTSKRSPRILDTPPDRFSVRGRSLSHQALQPNVTATDATTSILITARVSSEKKKHLLPVWKRRLGISSPAPQSESKRPTSNTDATTEPLSTHRTISDGLPPRGDKPPSNPSTNINSTHQYVNLMSRLEKLKHTRRMRAASSVPKSPSSTTRHTTTKPTTNIISSSCAAELEDFSSSSFSSTRFGGSTFMEALEVD